MKSWCYKIAIVCIAVCFIPSVLSSNDAHIEIVGGEEVMSYDSYEYKHSLRLLMNARISDSEEVPEEFRNKKIPYRCSGTLITEKAFITAAHCFMEKLHLEYPRGSGKIIGVPISEVSSRVYYGLSTEDLAYNTMSEYIIHPDYSFSWVRDVENVWNPSVGIHDIAIAILEYPIPYKKDAAPLIPASEVLELDTPLVLAGYGKSLTGGEVSPPKLRKVSTPFRGHLNNQSDFFTGIGDLDTPGEINNPGGACHGDSGGAAFYVDKNGIYHLAGVISRGPDNANGGCKAGVTILTGIQQYINWIMETLNEFK